MAVYVGEEEDGARGVGLGRRRRGDVALIWRNYGEWRRRLE